ncbi:DUF4407 domain-containing protein [Microbacteriaceae bacterium VKM Ac-2855]|nr:DUF4407 domain-containing protein [Microbacteriaceae bacterium VKM Ac-2855]
MSDSVPPRDRNPRSWLPARDTRPHSDETRRSAPGDGVDETPTNVVETSPQLEPWLQQPVAPPRSRAKAPKADPEGENDTVPIESLFETAETAPVDTAQAETAQSETAQSETAQSETAHVETAQYKTAQYENPEAEPVAAPQSEPDSETAQTLAFEPVVAEEPAPRASGRRRRFTFIRDENTLAVMGGARRDAIQSAPGDRQTYSAMALILIFTATVAALSMAFALGMVFHADWYWFIPVGIFWGAGIFAIDRALTIQLTHTKGVWRTLFAVIPRFALAAILGAVISTPVTLQIFEPEVSSEILVMEAEARTAYAAEIAGDPILATEADVRATITAAQSTLDQSDAVDPAQDPTYAAAKAAEDAALADYNAKQAAWVAESNGTGGTGVVGTGPITDIAKAAADAALVVYQQAQAATAAALTTATPALEAQLAQAKTQAAADLETAQASLATIETRKADFQAQSDAAVAASDGIANRLTALDRLSQSNAAAGLAHVMVFLLFFAIELLPVIIKLLRNLGDKESVHDTTAREKDAAQLARVRQRYGIDRDEVLLDAQIAAGRLATRRELAVQEEELALATGKRTNFELDQRARRKADAFFDEWDYDESPLRGRR